MKVGDIINRINQLLSNSTSYKLRYKDLRPYIDGAIDYINDTLRTEYATPQEAYDKEKLYYYLVSIGKFIAVPNKCNDIEFDEINRILKVNGVVQTVFNSVYDAVYIDKTNDAYILDNSGDWLQLKLSDVPENNILEYNYEPFPERYIRQCVVYKATALRLEEEDETEAQYSIYTNKAESTLVAWRKEHYSMYDCRW